MSAECLQLIAVRHAKAVEFDLNFVDRTAFAGERTGLRCLPRHTTTSLAARLGYPSAVQPCPSWRAS